VAIRSWIGTFSEKLTVFKWAKYMALSLSSSHYICHLNPEEFSEDHEDFYSDTNHLYSDGVGKMSIEIAQQIQDVMQFPHLPAVVQIRFKGYKGVLALDLGLSGRQIQLRKSMKKFQCMHTMLEVLKCSRFVPFTLTNSVGCLLLCLNVSKESFSRKVAQYFTQFSSAENCTSHLSRATRLGAKFRLPLDDAGTFIGY
jgi:RNA-dependent RNA polymerase